MGIRLSRNGIALSLLALGATLSVASGARAQVLYSNFTTPAIDTRNNSTAYLGTGGTFVLQTNASDPNSPLVSQMLLDDIFFANGAGQPASYNINSVSFKVANGATDTSGNPIAMNNVRVFLTVYEDDNGANPPNSIGHDGPGTQYGRFDLGLFNFAAPTANSNRAIASITDITASSSTLGNLTLPFDQGNNQKFWFGLFFEQDRDNSLSLANQQRYLGQVGVAMYKDVTPIGQGTNLPTGIGQSADVHDETGQDTGTQPLQRNLFNTGFGNGPDGQYDQYRAIFPGQDVNSNFAWLINGSISLVPEPTAGAFLLLGVPAFALVKRRRKPAKK